MNRHQLYAALAGAGIMTAAHAVQVGGDGRGQVLLFPYYTTRTDAIGNAYTTLLSVVNTTPMAKAVRVRFQEGKNSRELLGFNLFLSPFDVWTAAVLPDTTTSGAKIGTVDLSCTLPAFSASPTAPFVAFVNSSYAGSNDDGAGTGMDRTREGHFEIIEMATYASTSITGKAVTHINGVPPCGMNLSDPQAMMDAQPPTGGLFGATTFINVNSGTDYSADAVALANFYQTGSAYYPAGTPSPDLTQASPPMSTVLAPNGLMYESLWGAGNADAVSAVLMHDNLMNEYVLDMNTRSQTDWVVTMPTKRFYTNVGTGNAPKLFQRNFNGTAGSCDELGRAMAQTIWDREEHVPPYPPYFSFFGSPVFSLCWAANVVTFTNMTVSEEATIPILRSFVLGSANISQWTQFGIGSGHAVYSPYQNGWLYLSVPSLITGAFATVHKLINTGATSISGRGLPTTTGNTVTYVGLPVIGFAAMSFTNGTLVVGGQNVLSNYGGNFAHKTSTLIQ